MKIIANVPVFEKRGRKSLMRPRIQQKTEEHLVNLRRNSCPVTADIGLYAILKY